MLGKPSDFFDSLVDIPEGNTPDFDKKFFDSITILPLPIKLKRMDSKCI